MVDKAKEIQVEQLTIYEKLHAIQLEIRSPKDQKAKNYNYRSVENIIAALKPFLREYELLLFLDDDLVLIGDRYYIKSTAKIRNVKDEQEISTSAFAREQENLSIMSQGQLSGATSSFARKYALGALLGIDDTEDLDYPIKEPESELLKIDNIKVEALKALAKSKNVALEDIETRYNTNISDMNIDQYRRAVGALNNTKG